MPILAESKDKIKKNIFENGIVIKFNENEFNNDTNYNNQYRTAIKLDPFGILSGIT